VPFEARLMRGDGLVQSMKGQSGIFKGEEMNRQEAMKESVHKFRD